MPLATGSEPGRYEIVATSARGGIPGSEFMRTYVVTTGTVFGLLVVAHIWRVVEEGPGLAKDPVYLVITATAAALSLWAWLVLREKPRT